MDIAECFRRSRDGLMLLSGLMKIDLTGAMDSLVSEVGVRGDWRADPRLSLAENQAGHHADPLQFLHLYDLFRLDR